MAEGVAEPSRLPRCCEIAPMREVNSPETFHDYAFRVFFDLAMCMQCSDDCSPNALAWRLYTHISRQGKKGRGHYEMQLPHLLRVVCADTPGSPDDTMTGYIMKDPPGHITTRAALCVNPAIGLRPGLYLCSLELHLSNPWWRMESLAYDPDQRRWDLDDIIKHIPPGQPRSCEFRFTINILQYTAPFAAPDAQMQGRSAIWSWLPSRLSRAREEFNKVFVVGE